jgi:tetratricopeptide (TPR) repeat protein
MTQTGNSNKYRKSVILILSVICLILMIQLIKSPPKKEFPVISIEEEKKNLDKVLRGKTRKGSYTFHFLASQDDLWKRINKMQIDFATPMLNEALDSFFTGTQLLTEGRRNQNKLSLGRAIHKLKFSAESISTFETFYNLGYAYLEFGDYDQALMEFQRAFDYEKNHPGLYNGIGLCLVRLGRIKEGLDQLHMGLSIAENITNKAWKGKILGRLGEVYREKALNKIAQVYFQEAIIKSYEIGYMEGAVDSLCAYSELLINNSRKKMSRYLSNALDLAKKTNYQAGVAKAATILASYNQSKGKQDAALEFYQQALAAYMNIENSLGQAHIFNRIAKIHEQQGNLDQALKYYRESLLLHQQINHQEGKSNDLGNIGLIYYVKGNLDQALKYYQGALVVHEETGDQQKKSISLGNIGLIYLDKQESDKALVYLQNALTIDRRIDFKEGEALHLGNTGKAYLLNNSLEKARESFDNSLKLYREAGNVSGEAQQLNNLAEYYSKIEDTPKALKYHLDSLATFREVGNTEGEAFQMSKIGLLYRQIGEMDISLKYLNSSLEIFENAHKKTHRKFTGLGPVDLSRQMLTHD